MAALTTGKAGVLAPDLSPTRELIVRQGDPVTEILKAARDERIDLLVVACHRGEGGYQSQAIGSRLLRRAICAVLTVPI